ncbi:MAG: acyl-homoserine-lactone synthase [Alphaproteobacteria bacterium]
MPKITEIKIIDCFGQKHHNFMLINQFFELRKEVFVKKLGWTLDTFRDLEFDQYDTFLSRYIIATENDKVVGGARILQTNQKMPSCRGARPYSYMIKDSHDGMLTGLPANLCYVTPPVSSDIWEITRLCSVSNGVAPNLIMDKCIDYLSSQKAKEALFICTPAGVRYARRSGRKVTELGPIYENESGKFQAISFVLDGESSND